MNRFMRTFAALVAALFFAFAAWAEAPAPESSETPEAVLQEEATPPAIAEITVPAGRTLGVGEKYALPVTYAPAEAENTLTYASSNTKIARVDANGQVAAKKTGKAKITVKAASGVSAQCVITVKAAPKSVSLNQTKLTLGVGQTFQLKYTLSKSSAGSASYGGYDASVVSVGEDGTVTALSPGTTTITLKTYNGKKATCKVTVKPAPEAIDLSDAALTLCVGEARTLKATCTAGSAGECTFESSDKGIATVDKAGKVTAKGVGSATITARTYNGLFATCELTVGPAPTKVSFSQKTYTLGAGEKLKLDVSFGGGAAGAGCTFSSSSKSVVTVSADGTVTGKKAGKAKITVKTYNGKKATCTVNVVKAPSSVSLNQNRLWMGLGETFRLKATTSGGASGITWTSSDPDAVRVDANGMLTALTVDGYATITAETYNGKTAYCEVYVSQAPTALNFHSTSSAPLIQGQPGGISVFAVGGKCASVEFTSSDPSVLEIIPSGPPTTCEYKAKKAGTVTVTARAYNGVSISQQCTVQAGPTSASIKLPDTLVYGYQYNLDYFVQFQPAGISPDNIKSVSIKNKKVVGLNYMRDDGRWIAPMGLGSTTITVTMWNGVTVKKTVKVYYKKGYSIETTDGQIEHCSYMPVQ